MKTGGFFDICWGIDQTNDDKSGTAEQIATFQRSEGRKLDELRMGDSIVIDGTDEIVKIESLRGGAISGILDLGNSYSISLLGAPAITLAQTAEELQEEFKKSSNLKDSELK